MGKLTAAMEKGPVLGCAFQQASEGEAGVQRSAGQFFFRINRERKQCEAQMLGVGKCHMGACGNFTDNFSFLSAKGGKVAIKRISTEVLVV